MHWQRTVIDSDLKTMRDTVHLILPKMMFQISQLALRKLFYQSVTLLAVAVGRLINDAALHRFGG